MLSKAIIIFPKFNSATNQESILLSILIRFHKRIWKRLASLWKET